MLAYEFVVSGMGNLVGLDNLVCREEAKRENLYIEGFRVSDSRALLLHIKEYYLTIPKQISIKF